MKKLMLMAILAIVMTGCTTQLGKYTLYSPHRTDTLQKNCVVDNSRRLTGVNHANLYLVFPSAALTYDAAVMNAMNKDPECVALANVNIYRRTFWFLFGYCDFVAEGNPVYIKEDK